MENKCLLDFTYTRKKSIYGTGSPIMAEGSEFSVFIHPQDLCIIAYAIQDQYTTQLAFKVPYFAE